MRKPCFRILSTFLVFDTYVSTPDCVPQSFTTVPALDRLLRLAIGIYFQSISSFTFSGELCYFNYGRKLGRFES